MLTPGKLEEIPKALESVFSELEMRIFRDIVRRIKINGNVTRSADWQLYRLSELTQADKECKKYIQDALKLSDAEITKIWDEALANEYAHSAKIYKATGHELLPLAKNTDMQQIFSSYMQQTQGELTNITRSLGMMVDIGIGKPVVSPLSQVYMNILDGAMLDISSGAFDYNTVIKRVISDMTRSGLRQIDYISGHHNRVEVAARRAVMTGVTQVAGKINESVAADLETDMFEVSAHVGARNTGDGYFNHSNWQGKVYPMSELKSICGLGKGGGLAGWGCRHSYYPFVLGVSERLYTDADLKALKEREAKTIKWGDKEYDTYGALQRQRKLETLMRKQRQDIDLLKHSGIDPEEITKAKAKYSATMKEYGDFSAKMKLPQQMARVYEDGLGRVGGK